MKRILSIVLVLAIGLGIAGCNSTGPTGIAKTTLMIYMIGSDLEAKSGAGTQDLAEMAASGVDLNRVDVLVYAGGSPHWHNDMAKPEQHTLLHLTENGFEPLTTTDASSMGQAECLTNFLNYGYTNFPAESYGLILWDHGNGPVIGYGKDMLFENDCLTLKEMSQAMEASPFRGDNKLDWVGFDACLMASAELACVWAPYARYLVASQEVEPAFGWNYSFLSQVGTCDIPTLLGALSQSYMDACLAYFEERGYDDRDTTLSCMDLSRAPDLENALNALFARASADVDTQYNQLTARRAQARALGRASTGSEYDLIDLLDMAIWLGELYPEEVTALQGILQKMVISNTTNAQGLCGLSLYYPFYNKAYYEKDWSAAYEDLGLFDQYQSYLEGYERKWLNSDLLDQVASSATPQQIDQQTYTLQLTPEQNESFVSCKYYIMEQQGAQVYIPMFTSSNVVNEDGLLTASFDGDILYVKDGLGNYMIPTSIEHDTVGDHTRYSVYVNLSNDASLLATLPDDFEPRSENHSFHLAVDRNSKDISVSALIPYDHEVDSDSLTGGKLEDADLSQWTTYTFPFCRPMYLTRHENNTVRSIWEWPTSSILSAYEMKIANGLDFVYAPLVAGEYYLIFEITDTQGNRYCSELIPIHSDGKLPEKPLPAPKQIDWKDGNKQLLMEKDGVSVYIELARDSFYETDYYTLTVDNTTNKAVIVSAGDMTVNGNVSITPSAGCVFEVLPNSSYTDEYGLGWGELSEMQAIDRLESIRLNLDIEEALSGKTIVEQQSITIQLPQDASVNPAANLSDYYIFNKPLREMYADEQVITQHNDLQLTLLSLGGNGTDNSRMQANIRWENNSDSVAYGCVQGFVFNGIYIPAPGRSLDLAPGMVSFETVYVPADDLDKAGITSIAQAKIVVRYDKGDTLMSIGNSSQTKRFPIKLQQSGTASPFPSGTLILKEKGIRIRLLDYEGSAYSNRWYVSIENNSGKDICLAMVQTALNGEMLPDNDYHGNAIYKGAVGAGEKTIAEFSFIDFDGFVLENMAFNIRVMDFNQERTLFVCSTRINLTVPEE